MIHKNVVGVDIGGTNLRIGCADQTGVLSHFQKVPIGQVLTSEQPLADIAKFIKRYVDGIQKPIAAFAIGFPATMDKERTTLYNTPNLQGLNNVNAKEALQTALGTPVFLEKDVAMLFLNDVQTLQVDTEGVCSGFYFGTGIGNVIAVDGQILTGNDGVAAELGHIPVLGKTDICNCGNVGCLENYTSGRGLEALCATHFPEAPIKTIFQTHGDHPIIRAYIASLAIPIAIEVNLLNPKTVILGGGVLNMVGFDKALLEQAMLYHCRKPLPADNLHWVYSIDGDENGVRGAVRHALQKLK